MKQDNMWGNHQVAHFFIPNVPACVHTPPAWLLEQIAPNWNATRNDKSKY